MRVDVVLVPTPHQRGEGSEDQHCIVGPDIRVYGQILRPLTTGVVRLLAVRSGGLMLQGVVAVHQADHGSGQGGYQPRGPRTAFSS